VAFNFPRLVGGNDARLGVAGADPQPVIAMNGNFFLLVNRIPY
jgi:hypothetical protein